jgi:hypothetical protein
MLLRVGSGIITEGEKAASRLEKLDPSEPHYGFQGGARAEVR